MPASKKEAKEFVKRWQKRLAAIPAGSNNEQQDTQKFWVDLLINVLGIPSNTIDSFVDFERKVRGRRIDVFVSDHNLLCEQKSWGIDLDKPEPRNGGMETPLQQAMWYARHLPYSERPRWVMTCNFGTFRLYDLDNERPEDTVQEFSLEELPDSLYLLSFLTSNETSRLHKEQQLSIEAGAYVSRLYDALAKQYHHIEEKDERAQEEQRSLNVLITRIIFLLYAEDADLLQSHQAFGRYCEGDPAKLRRKLVDLFETIDTPLEQRDEYMDEDLAAFPYVNGGLFADSSIIVPQMTSEILEAIADASQDFDWREISGVIFGGVFEGTLNPETRHAGGMHYTSVENIERCLRPLFLDELWDELHEAEGEKTAAKRKQALARLHDKVASITIGDPACGSGNFLTEAYRQLRTIENRIIEDELSEETGNAGQTSLVVAQDSPVRVSLDQLYGIEINDFAVSVAKTALWITEEQMLRKTQEIYVGYDFDFLPLRSLSNLHEGNALKTDWSEVFPDDLTYLVGNPPFLGARNQSKEQKAELLEVFDGAKNAGNIDYCGAWYMKAARFTQGKRTRCALVSTNSICQGEQVANLWKPLHDLGIHIDFAHNTFRWDNEAADKAHVFCVIVGFSRESGTKTLFYHATPDSDEEQIPTARINAYLKDAPDVFIYSRSKPICDVPEMGIGNKPIDGGFYLFTDEEKDDFLIARDPIGVIPLYIGKDKDGKIYCASELKALEGFCDEYEPFLPGHYYWGKEGKMTRWYVRDWFEYEAVKNNNAYSQDIHNGLEEAVKRQLMSDVPYGVLLSGGLDSSVISAIAKKYAGKRVETDNKKDAWWPQLHSFAIGLEGAPDLIKAREVARFIGTVHHEIHYTIQEGLDAIRDVIYYIETYDVTTVRASTPMYLLARVIKSMGIKMVLSGEGADEVFGGYLYFHKAPTAQAFHEETVRKLGKLHLYDCLRANKSLAAWGVEGRVPFLDKEFLDIAMRLNPEAKMCPGNTIEKKVVRKAFADMLPDSVAWRQKEQFSDGVGYSWIDTLKALTAEAVSDEQMAHAAERFPINTPQNKEEYYYRSIFQEHFPSESAARSVPSVPSVACSTAEALTWDAAFKNMNEPSGRAVKGVHEEAYDS